MSIRFSLFVLCVWSAFGTSCYHHARRDAPAAPPSAVASEMAGVPSMTFTMGDNNGEPDEYPERSVSVSAFRIDRTEVTNRAYKACVNARACDPGPFLDDEVLGADDHPVVGVTWLDADRFCRWLGRALPTEAQWEAAARGPEFRKWPWSGGFDPKKANTSSDQDAFKLTAPVGSFPDGSSPFGLLDMAGNVAEWVADYYDPVFHRREGVKDVASVDPVGPTSGRERVVRGGSYREGAHLLRVSSRRAQLPTESDNTIGFRCALSGG
ncbi:MAG: SUMF1/EgtB/PvdO family nonheme iron enzyme [Myxococcota bacterium]